jgi:hypothetical protein
MIREVYTYRWSNCLDDKVMATSRFITGFRMELTVSFLLRGGNLSPEKMRLNIDNKYVGFEVLTAVVTNISNFWDITTCSPYMNSFIHELHGAIYQKMAIFIDNITFIPQDCTFLRNL